MKFHFCLANHCPVGRRTLEDMIAWFTAGLEDLGHEVTVSNNRVDPSAINIFWEQFFPGFKEEVLSTGITYGIIATEIPDGVGFNWRSDGTWLQRFQTFSEVAKHAAFIWTMVEQTVPYYSQYAPTAYIELGFSERLIPAVNAKKPDIDFFFFGLSTSYRERVISELSQYAQVIWPKQIISKKKLNEYLARTKIGLCFRQSEEWPVPSPTRLGRLLMAQRGIVQEKTKVITRQASIVPLVPDGVPFTEFALGQLHEGKWKRDAESSFQAYRELMPMRKIMENVLERTVSQLSVQEKRFPKIRLQDWKPPKHLGNILGWSIVWFRKTFFAFYGIQVDLLREYANYVGADSKVAKHRNSLFGIGWAIFKEKIKS